MQKKKPTTSVTSLRDRLSYLWLALGILFFAFATVNGQTALPHHRSGFHSGVRVSMPSHLSQ